VLESPDRNTDIGIKFIAKYILLRVKGDAWGRVELERSGRCAQRQIEGEGGETDDTYQLLQVLCDVNGCVERRVVLSAIRLMHCRGLYRSPLLWQSSITP